MKADFPPPTQYKFQTQDPLPSQKKDERGYFQHTKPATDNPGFFDITARFQKGNIASAETQRKLGYQYYTGEPGKDPYYMHKVEQDAVTGAFWNNVCTLL